MRDAARTATAKRVFGVFLFAYPSSFREEYGRELCLVFADRYRETQTAGDVLALWAAAIWGVLREAPREHYLMLLQDLRHAFRVLRQNPTVTAAAIAILALGIGSTTLVFSLVNGLLLRPLPYPSMDRIVAIDEYSPTDANEYGTVNFLNYLDFRSRSRLVTDMGLYDSGGITLISPGTAAIVPGARVTDGVFATLGVAPILGRTLTSADCQPRTPRVAIISQEFWHERFGGDSSVIGKELATPNARYQIVGVMPENFHFPDRAEIWFPLQTDPAAANRTDYNRSAIARLAPGASVAAASAELESLLRTIHRENPAANNEWHARAISLRDSLAADYRKGAITLLIAVCLLLLIACANVGNLLLVRSSVRGREFAVRAAIGASRSRLLRQLATESLLLGAAGGLVGVLLAYLGTPALIRLIPVEIPRWMNFQVDQRVLLFGIAVSLLTSLTCGLAPMFAATAGDLARTLKEGGRSGTRAGQKKLRHALVVAEVALSVALLIGAGLIIRSVHVMDSQPLGYAPDNVLSFAITYPDRAYPDGPKARALIDTLCGEFAGLPGVVSAAAVTERPLETSWTRIFTIEGRPVPLKEMPFVAHTVVTPGYFQTLRLPLIQGRYFSAADFDAPVMIVSRSFAHRHWPDESAIGKRVRFGPPKNNEPWHTIIGVVEDAKVRGLKQSDATAVFLPYGSQITPNAFVVRASGDPLKLASAIRGRIAATDSAIAVNRFLTLDQIHDRADWRERFLAVLVACFTGFALTLAAVGFYAMLAYLVALQRREIGIRIALGASASGVERLIAAEGLRIAIPGLVLGGVTAFGLTRLLRSQLFEISPTDPASWITAVAVFVAVAVAATVVPARRASRVDPVLALREE